MVKILAIVIIWGMTLILAPWFDDYYHLDGFGFVSLLFAGAIGTSMMLIESDAPEPPDMLDFY